MQGQGSQQKGDHPKKLRPQGVQNHLPRPSLKLLSCHPEQLHHKTQTKFGFSKRNQSNSDRQTNSNVSLKRVRIKVHHQKVLKIKLSNAINRRRYTQRLIY